MADSNQWELSKENIQPIKQGRRATILSTAIDETQQKKLILQKQEFEKEIRIYSGDDPLSVWYRYALWIEQNYPKGGRDGNLMKLLESCFSTLNTTGEVDKYKNDERFLDLWIKYINLCPCPLEVYQTLYTKNYCTELANFYGNWAWEMEKSGNIKKTNAIYVDGLQRKTKNAEVLDMSYKKFQARVAKLIKEGMDFSIGENNENVEPHRVVLSALKTTGTKSKPPTERVSGIIGSAGRIPVAKIESKTNSLGPVFKIFEDENSSRFQNPLATESNSSSESLPLKSSYAKENFKEPSKWAKNKVGQKTTSLVPIEDVDRYHKPAFVVHADEDSTFPRSTPVKRPDLNGVLSTRKKPNDEWHVPLFIQEPFNPLVQPQYDKNKVYCGTEEFSFEELRAAKVLKEESNLKEKKEQQKMKDEVEALKEMVKQQQQLISTFLNQKSCAPLSIKPESRMVYEDSWVAVNKSISFAANKTSAHDISNMLGQGLEDTLEKPLTCKQDVSLAPLLVPNIGEGTGPHSNSNSFKDYMTSPTINTKIANNLVNGFFNGSLFHNSINSGEFKSSFECPKVNPNSNPTPSKLVQDENKVVEVPKSCPQQIPFTIFSDYENIGAKVPNNLPLGPATPFSIFCDENNTGHLEKESKKLEFQQNENLDQPYGHVGQKKTERVPFATLSGRTDDVKEIPSNFKDENDENLCPKGYHQTEEKRQLAGILLPSINIPYISLEEQEKMFADEEEKKEEAMEGMDGVEPFKDESPDDFTIKVPVNSEAFAKMACFASTPRPWCFGLVPQFTQSGEDFTMAMPIKSQQMEIVGKHLEKDISSSLKFDNQNSSSNEEVKENSGELMPPPKNFEELEPENSVKSVNNEKESVSSIAATTPINLKLHLSPIMEASREYRSSSSSSSSSGCTTFGGNSNYHGLSHLTHTTTASRSIQFSQSRALTGNSQMTQNESYGGLIHQNEISKSGYFADKSRGESISEVPHRFGTKVQKTLQVEDKEKFDSSFDPSKIAAMLLDMDSNLDDMGCQENSPNLTSKLSDIKSSESCPETPLDVMSFNYPTSIDPFCQDLQVQLLSSLKEPVNARGGFVALDFKFPQVKPNIQLTLGKEMFHVKRAKGTGAYAQVFQATTIDPLNVTVLPPTLEDDNSGDEADDESQMILKVQKPACYWEFYICHELRCRLKKKNCSLNIIDSLMRVNRGYFFKNGSILVSQYHKYGTLLDFVNKIRSRNMSIHEGVVIFLMIQITKLLESLHSCQIIHGDFKPDNIMITGVPDLTFSNVIEVLEEDTLVVKLIDFGRSVDMNLFPQGTTFIRKVTTDGFTCNEMKENRPWTYQTDLYGLACVAHILLFGSYMNVKKENGKYNLVGVTFQRRWNKELWQTFFDQMLNIPSCSEIPNLDLVLKQFISVFQAEDVTFRKELKNVVPIINQGK